jgi:hypothetical protein
MGMAQNQPLPSSLSISQPLHTCSIIALFFCKWNLEVGVCNVEETTPEESIKNYLSTRSEPSQAKMLTISRARHCLSTFILSGLSLGRVASSESKSAE